MINGIGASKGYAIGTAFLKVENEFTYIMEKNILVEDEINKLCYAVEESREQLIEIHSKASLKIGEHEAAVFESHLKMLEDPEFIGSAQEEIKTDNISAVEAVQNVVKSLLEMFYQIDDEYLRERAADIKDVGDRLLRNLTGKGVGEFSSLRENTIIVAHDLAPSDTAQLDRNKISAFITDLGGRTSHSAIMARTLEIPAVVGLGDITGRVETGDTIIVDGVEGIVIINPDDKTFASYKEKRDRFLEERNILKGLINAKSVTKSGKEVIIAGNIGSVEDVEKLLENGADGVGLFRTEFLYMDRSDMPTEEEQFSAYKQVAEKMKGKPVVIRTLDIGGDKKLPYLPLPEEENPFLGFRAIRLCLNKTEMFKSQLRAILRASVYGNIQVMFPMISSLDEFLKAKSLLSECMTELEKEGLVFNKHLEVGIMIEIPSAALIADELAKHADFFSIGTNDLIQYALAADRMNENVAYLYNPMHPAVLKLIKQTIDAAHKEGKWCGMCGEMAGDENSIPLLLEYGLDEFSMSASSILGARRIVVNHD